ncbi:MAG: N-acetyl-gamma-glutamyl-phosphate reductase, partial [Saprospiraceae bacterium]|nr:N-acetyl-gamma-glutamyl-phosphate reductase [Saprospiraceae bacterium]
MLNNSKIRAGIIGGAGYTGGELLRLLLHHPAVEIAFVQSRSQAGKAVTTVHTDLLGETDLHFSAEMDEAEVWFLCLGHGEARQWLEAQPLDRSVKIIDLSQDFRLGGSWGERTFVYGLPEINRAQIQAAELIANPGCFATGIQLALLPLATAGLLKEVFITGITGATGGGQSLAPTAHFPWRHANVSAYKTLIHQHLAEVSQTLTLPANDIHFVPWRGDFARGIYLSATTRCDLTQTAVLDLYRQYYESHPFTVVSDQMGDLKMAVNTNKCLLFPEKQGQMLVVHA